MLTLKPATKVVINILYSKCHINVVLNIHLIRQHKIIVNSCSLITKLFIFELNVVTTIVVIFKLLDITFYLVLLKDVMNLFF